MKNCIDEKGKLNVNQEDLAASFRSAEALCESLIGATLHIRGKSFVIRMLEIYYGSVQDETHDWFRNRFVYKKSKYVNHTEVQAQKGYKIYLSSPNIEDTYTRLDIVVGDEGVAISFLIRSVWDEYFNIIGQKNGSPHLVLKAMGIKGEDHGSDISLGGAGQCEISIEHTHDKIYVERGLSTKTRKRINLKSKFEDAHNLEWNLCAV